MKLYLLCLLLILLEQVGGESRVRERINKVVEKEKLRALEEAIDAEFELADKDEDGKINREEFGKYLKKEDHFTIAKKRKKEEGVWLGKSKTEMPLEKKTEIELDNHNFNNNNNQYEQVGGNVKLDEGPGFISSFLNSVMMIIVTELGDKTFFIAALLAMKNSRLIVYLGAIGALVLMTILSVLIGSALPAFLPRVYTHYGAAFLFLGFGIKMLQEARELYLSPPKKNEELEEAEEEISSFYKVKDEGDNLEKGSVKGLKKHNKLMKVLIQAFTMTFLAEWGDRSQIATIALASAQEPFGVTLGGCIGHGLCTGLAVLGGRLLATRISEKQITLTGGLLFCVFALHSFIMGP